MTIKLTQRQFPVQVAFAMSINKVQGQTLQYVGIDLHKPVFAHGQLYIALSRATSLNNVSAFLNEDVPETETRNVVYSGVLID
jgi:ATP-dependent exoDNAse (exonuclease V) alpha subunit